MKVSVFNASGLPRDARRPRLLESACRAALGQAARRAGGELNVVLLRRGPMRRIAKRYLGHDYDTDVIAFPYKAPPGPAAAAAPFGDVFISIDLAGRQARELGHPLIHELATLAIHGTLHLVGYRDDLPAQKRRMFARQERLLRKLLARPRAPRADGNDARSRPPFGDARGTGRKVSGRARAPRADGNDARGTGRKVSGRARARG